MLSVTDNSRGARGDVTAVAVASPNSEANLDRYGESCQPVHFTQLVQNLTLTSALAEGLERPSHRGPGRFWTRPIRDR